MPPFLELKKRVKNAILILSIFRQVFKIVCQSYAFPMATQYFRSTAQLINVMEEFGVHSWKLSEKEDTRMSSTVQISVDAKGDSEADGHR